MPELVAAGMYDEGRRAFVALAYRGKSVDKLNRTFVQLKMEGALLPEDSTVITAQVRKF